MLKRLTINMLLKSVIVAMAAAVVVQLSLGAWNSWIRYGSVSRIAASTDASAYLFTALHNLRVDRSSTTRDLTTEKISATPSPLLKKTRDAEMPALKAGVEALKLVDFAERDASVAALSAAVAKLETLQKDSLAAMAQPKASRPAGLTQDFFSHVTGLIELLDKISSQLTRAVKLEDAYIDQLMDLKQLAWVARNSAGDASVIISNGLGGLPLPKDTMMVYSNHLAKLDTAWAAVKDVAAGMPVPKSLTDAIAKAQQEFLGPEFTELRLKNLKAIIAGEKLDIKADDWSTMSVAKLGSLLVVAERALDVAKAYAIEQRGNALQSLSIQLGLLVLAVVVASGIILMISRRVTGPLFAIQQTMLKLAAGEFNVTLPGLERKDEIGDVANAVERFKVLAVEKAQQQSAELMERQKADAAKQAEAARLESERAAKAAQEES